MLIRLKISYFAFVLSLMSSISGMHNGYIPYAYDEKNHDWYMLLFQEQGLLWNALTCQEAKEKGGKILEEKFKMLTHKAFEKPLDAYKIKTYSLEDKASALSFVHYQYLPESQVLRTSNPHYNFVRISFKKLLKTLEKEQNTVKAKSKTFKNIELDPSFFIALKSAQPFLQALCSFSPDQQKPFSFKKWSIPFLHTVERAKDVKSSDISAQEFIATLEQSLALFTNELERGTWLREKPDKTQSFKPYVQKVIIPAKSTLVLWGDLHGSAHSLIRSLQALTEMNVLDDTLKLKEGWYCCFLGDLIDRAHYGVELLYLLMKLKLRNPQQVFFARGNHDSYHFNHLFHSSAKTRFQEEIKAKFPHQAHLDKLAYSLFEYFPLALYIGSGSKPINFIQCCHGALELGFNPQEFLSSNKDFQSITSIDRAHALSSLKNELAKEITRVIDKKRLCKFVPTDLITPLKDKPAHHGLKIGFTWHEFIPHDATTVVDAVSESKADREIVYGKPLVQHLLKLYSSDTHILRAIFRGHQHHDTMLARLKEKKGLVEFWDGTVYTLFSGTASVAHHKFPYDAFTMVETAEDYKDWHICQWSQEIL